MEGTKELGRGIGTAVSTAQAFAAWLGRHAINFAFPPLCMSCGVRTLEAQVLCAKCWHAVSFIVDPVCVRCGFPFEIDPGAETVCAACHAAPFAFDRARSVFRYDEGSKALVLAFKYGDRLERTPGFAHWLSAAGRSLIEEADMIVPVPLHRWRLWRRRYNQAAMLAKRLASSSGKRYAPEVLERARATPSQGTMPSAKARRRNVLGAFRVPVDRRVELRGKAVVLIDDVFTTGATLNACARALHRAGAKNVSALTLARVVRPAPGAI